MLKWLKRRGKAEGAAAARQPGKVLTWRQKAQRIVSNWRLKIVPWLSTVLLVAIVTVPLILFAWWFFFTDIFSVQAVTVVDAREHTEQAARDITNRKLENVPLGKNIFFVQTEIIESEIVNSLPQVRTVHVVRKLPATIKVIVQEKTPALLMLSSGQYYFVDEAGVPYEEAKLETLPGVVLPTVKNDDRDAVVKLGARAVGEEFVAFVRQIQDELPAYVGSDVVEIHIPSLAAREVHFNLTNNWQIRFDVDRSATGQLKILRELMEVTISEEEKTKLEYIDLRIRERIYYKLAS